MNKRRRYKAKARRAWRLTLSRRQYWREDCLHWRGRLLVGRESHWCWEWDGLPMDETCYEYPCGCL